MSQYDHNNLKNLAKLCRIHCSDKELDTLTTHLQDIIDLVSQLQEVDTRDVPPCNHVGEVTQSFMREDDPQEGISRESFLKNSPSHVGGMIRVPPVIKF